MYSRYQKFLSHSIQIAVVQVLLTAAVPTSTVVDITFRGVPEDRCPTPTYAFALENMEQSWGRDLSKSAGEPFNDNMGDLQVRKLFLRKNTASSSGARR